MLLKKMFRDIKLHLSSFITVFLMVLIGVFVYAGINGYMTAMQESVDVFYENENLADLFVTGENFSDDDLEKIKSINHVKNAERKLTLTGSIVSDEDLTVQMNFIESNDICKFYVEEGEGFNRNKNGIWIDSYWAKNLNLKLGDKITLNYDGYTFEEKEIIGIIYVPDHVYDVKDESAIFPTHTDYGYVYLSIDEFPEEYIRKSLMDEYSILYDEIIDFIIVGADIDLKDLFVFNNVLIDVDEEENIEEVKSIIENDIESAIVVLPKEKTLSYATYQSEINEGYTYSGVFTGLFLLIAILSVITTMSRFIKLQRTEIGTLKALGFKNRKVNLLYVGYGFFISLIGSIIGLLVSFGLAKLFLDAELAFYEVPYRIINVSKKVYIMAVSVVFVISLITYLSCRSTLREKAADVLRPKAPKGYKIGILEKLKLFNNLGFATKWNLRDIFRNKMRVITNIVGIVGCTMLLVCGFGMLDTMNNFLKIEFEDLSNFSYKLILNDDISNKDLKKIYENYDVSSSETVPIEIIINDKKEVNQIIVDNTNKRLRYVDLNNDEIDLKSDGVYISNKVSSKYNLNIGDMIKWKVVGEDEIEESKIIGINTDPVNQCLVCTKDYFEKLKYEYKEDVLYTDMDLSNVREIPGVDNILSIESTKDGMMSMLSVMYMMIVILVIAASVLGSVIIYNLGILSITEKNYQFATLKVLGFRNKAIKNIFSKQNVWITIISIIIGLPLGKFMTSYIFYAALGDDYDFRAFIKPLSYIYAIIGTFIVSYLVNKWLSRKVDKIDMVMSLKGSE